MGKRTFRGTKYLQSVQIHRASGLAFSMAISANPKPKIKRLHVQNIHTIIFFINENIYRNQFLVADSQIWLQNSFIFGKFYFLNARE